MHVLPLLVGLALGCGDDDGPADEDAGGDATAAEDAEGDATTANDAESDAAEIQDGGASDPVGLGAHTAAATGDVGRDPATLYFGVRPAIIHYDAREGDLVATVAKHESPATASDWETHVIASEGDVGRYAAATIVDGRALVAYYDATNGDLRVARAAVAVPTETRDWTTFTVATEGDVGRFVAVLHRPFAEPAATILVYYDATGHDLAIAESDGLDPGPSDWMLGTIDTAGDVGMSPSIGADGDALRVSYYDATHGALRVASGAPGAFVLETVDDAGDVGLESVIFGSTVAYYDATNGDVKVAIDGLEEEGEWSLSTLDTEGDVGRSMTGTRFGARDALVYRNATTGALRVAHRARGLGQSELFDAPRDLVASGAGDGASVLFSPCFEESIEGVGVVAALVAYRDDSEGDLGVIYDAGRQGRWFHHRLSALRNGAFDPGLVGTLAGKPVVVYRSNDAVVHVARATRATPTHLSDWVDIEATRAEDPPGVAAIVGDRVAMLFYDPDTDRLQYRASDGPSPTSPTSFTSHDVLGAPVATHEDQLHLAAVGGAPMGLYQLAQTLHLVHADSGAPSSASDWTDVVVTDDALPITSAIIEFEGAPAILFQSASTGDIEIARASSASPRATADFTLSEVVHPHEGDGPTGDVDVISIEPVVTDDVLSFAYYAGSAGYLARTTNPITDGFADWQTHPFAVGEGTLVPGAVGVAEGELFVTQVVGTAAGSSFEVLTPNTVAPRSPSEWSRVIVEGDGRSEIGMRPFRGASDTGVIGFAELEGGPSCIQHAFRVD